MGWIAVALGGALGALFRAGLYSLVSLTGKPGLFALPTLLANLSGSFLIGVAFFLLVEHTVLPDPWRAFVMTGFLGGFTTFSTFSLDCFRMIQSGLWIQALVYSIISVVICVVLTYAGYAIAARFMN